MTKNTEENHIFMKNSVFVKYSLQYYLHNKVALPLLLFRNHALLELIDFGSYPLEILSIRDGVQLGL